MNRVVIILFCNVLMLCFKNEIQAQQDSLFDARVEIKWKNGVANVHGSFINNTPKKREFTYQLNIERRDNYGNKYSGSQAGAFESKPYGEQLIALTKLQLDELAFYRIHLKIYHPSGKLIAEDFLLKWEEEAVSVRKDEVAENKQEAAVIRLPPTKSPTVVDVARKTNTNKILEIVKLDTTSTTKNTPTPPKSATEVSEKQQPILTEGRAAPLAFNELEIDGLIIDETRTKAGRDFYELFYKDWVAPKEANDYQITFRELPARGRSARMAVFVNDNQVMVRMLQPRQELLEAQASNAIAVIAHHLKSKAKLVNDLKESDQAGSGLY